MAKTGRPRVSSRAVLEEAATELFLEQGYQATSIDEIASRAGVSRATFFNYFETKAEVLLVEIDRALDHFGSALEASGDLRGAIDKVARAISRADIPLVAQQADTMGATDEVNRALLERLARLRGIIATVVPEPVWQWAIAAAIAEGARHWVGQMEAVSLAESIDRSLEQLSSTNSQNLARAVS